MHGVCIHDGARLHIHVIFLLVVEHVPTHYASCGHEAGYGISHGKLQYEGQMGKIGSVVRINQPKHLFALRECLKSTNINLD